MSEHAMQQARTQDAAARQYVQSVVGASPSPADEIARPADLKAAGTITDEEFQAGKAKALAGGSALARRGPFRGTEHHAGRPRDR